MHFGNTGIIGLTPRLTVLLLIHEKARWLNAIAGLIEQLRKPEGDEESAETFEEND